MIILILSMTLAIAVAFVVGGIIFLVIDGRNSKRELRELNIMLNQKTEKEIREGNRRLENFMKIMGVKTEQIFERVDNPNT